MVKERVDAVIIGAGLTGLSLAYFLAKNKKNVLVLEKNKTVGGVIKTVNKNGFKYELGPNTGVIGSEGIVKLFDDLKHDCVPETPLPEAKDRWILKKGKWEPIPTGLIKAIKTPLFTLKDKFRVLGEPWRKKGTNPDENLADMVKRRLGDSFLDYAVDPFVSGIYAGDSDRLITKYALPKLYNLEQDYGSFIKGAIKKKKEPKTELQQKVTREVFSVNGGLSNLITSIENNILSDSILCECSNIKVDKNEHGFKTSFKLENGEGKEVSSNNVITTFGGENLQDILNFIPIEELKPVLNMTYAKVVQVVIGYKKWNGKRLNAFGGLVPGKENRDILGILFPGTLFKNRCPEQGALLSVFIGGIKKPDMILKTDEELKSLVLKEIDSTLNCSDEPELFEILKYENAIPQYDISTKDRYSAIEQLQAKNKGLYLAGNIRDGIGMADRVNQAWELSKLLSEKN